MYASLIPNSTFEKYGYCVTGDYYPIEVPAEAAFGITNAQRYSPLLCFPACYTVAHFWQAVRPEGQTRFRARLCEAHQFTWQVQRRVQR